MSRARKHARPWRDTASAREPDETGLRERLKHGERAAAGEFYDACAPRIARFIAQALGGFNTPQDTEDLMQETFISMAEAIPFFRGESTLLTFACAIAHRKVQSFLRTGARRARIAETYYPPAAPRPATPAATGDLARALGALEPGYRAILHLKYVEDFSVTEIAAIRGESGHAVESRLARARRALKKLMEK